MGLIVGYGRHAGISLATQSLGNGILTEHRYDEDRPLPTIGSSQPGAGFVSTLRSYDAAGRVKSVTDANGHQTTFDYFHGPEGAIRKTTSPTGETIVQAYDWRGLLASEELDHGWISGRTMTVTRDHEGRAVGVDDSSGATMKWGYNSLGEPLWESATGKISSTWSITRILRDDWGRVVGSRMETWNGAGDLVDIINYTQDLDLVGNVVARTDGLGQETTYQRDVHGRVVGELRPDGFLHTFRYDLGGRPVAFDDAVFQHFSPDGRLLGRTSTGGSAGMSTIQEFSYDALGNLVAATDNNDPALPTDDWTVRHRFDSLGRVITSEQGGNVVAYERDGVGNVVRLVHPESPLSGLALPVPYAVTKSYDGADRLLEASDVLGLVSSFEYRAGHKTKQSLGNGVDTMFSYDASLRLTGITTGSTGNPYGLNLEYEYDDHNRRSMENNVLGGMRAHSYDGFGRLVAAFNTFTRPDGTLNPGWPKFVGAAEAFGYDDANNIFHRSSVPPVDYEFNEANEMTRVDVHWAFTQTITIAHDAQGNRMREDDVAVPFPSGHGILYEWDALNRLRRISDQTGTVIAEYDYDALGRRVVKTVSRPVAETVTLVYDGDDLIQERRIAGVKEFVHGQGPDEPLMMINNGVRYYYHRDALGSVHALTDQAGDVEESYAYTVFGWPVLFEDDGDGVPDWGDVAPGTGDTIHEPWWPDWTAFQSTVGNPFMYTGQVWDPESGLYYYKARYYDSFNNRFLSRDPIGTWTDWNNLGNAYTYVGNNPVMYTDPTGEVANFVVQCGIGAVIDGGFSIWEHRKSLFGKSFSWKSFGAVGTDAAIGCGTGMAGGHLVKGVTKLWSPLKRGLKSAGVSGNLLRPMARLTGGMALGGANDASSQINRMAWGTQCEYHGSQTVWATGAGGLAEIRGLWRTGRARADMDDIRSEFHRPLSDIYDRGDILFRKDATAIDGDAVRLAAKLTSYSIPGWISGDGCD